MSTTQCETGIVRIRVGSLNDILRFNYDLYAIFYFYQMDNLFICSICTQRGNERRRQRSCTRIFGKVEEHNYT